MGAVTEKGKVYTYIIRGKKDYHYCGITSDIDKRFNQHNTGKARSTRKYLPYDLKFLSKFNTRTEARRLEVTIKNTGVKNWYNKNILFGTRSNMVCTQLISKTAPK